MPLYLKTALFTCIAPGTATVLLPYVLLSWTGNLSPSGWGLFRVGGVFLSAMGFGAYLSCARRFVIDGHGTPAPIDAPTQLVLNGPYRYTRNPMYVAVLTIIAGEVLYFGSFVLFLYGLVWFAGFHMFIVLYEEPTLERLFGKNYAEMCDEVPRWLMR